MYRNSMHKYPKVCANPENVWKNVKLQSIFVTEKWILEHKIRN